MAMQLRRVFPFSQELKRQDTSRICLCLKSNRGIFEGYFPFLRDWPPSFAWLKGLEIREKGIKGIVLAINLTANLDFLLLISWFKTNLTGLLCSNWRLELKPTIAKTILLSLPAPAPCSLISKNQLEPQNSAGHNNYYNYQQQ